MQSQLLICGKQLTAFLFQQALRRQPGPPFHHQLFRQVHPALRQGGHAWHRIRGRQLRISVKGGLKALAKVG